MNPTSRQLVSRDPAMAALMGLAIAGAAGADFGWEGDGDMGAELESDYGAEFGYSASFGAAAAASKALSPAHPSHPAHAAFTAHAHALALKHAATVRKTSMRESLIEPNKGSTVKVQWYDFSIPITPNFTIGTAVNFSATLQPSVTIKPKKFFTNVPTVAFVTLTTVQVANVSALVGSTSDAFAYNMGSNNGSQLHLPTLSPSNRATVAGGYTGAISGGFALAFSFPFITTFQGWATIVA